MIKQEQSLEIPIIVKNETTGAGGAGGGPVKEQEPVQYEVDPLDNPVFGWQKIPTAQREQNANEQEDSQSGIEPESDKPENLAQRLQQEYAQNQNQQLQYQQQQQQHYNDQLISFCNHYSNFIGESSNVNLQMESVVSNFLNHLEKLKPPQK